MSEEQIDSLLINAKKLMSEQELSKMLYSVGDSVGTLAESFAKEYPESPNRPLVAYYIRVDKNGKSYFSKFKSPQQQRYVLWLAGRGKIPYKRSGLLGKSVTHDVAVESGGVAIRVGTNLAYAPKVIGLPTQQNHYNIVTGWKSLEQEIDNHQDEIDQLIVAKLAGYVDGFLKK